MRFELNDKGIEQLVTLAHHSNRKRSTGGEIIRESGSCWVVKWDNRVWPTTISKSYITVLEPTDTGSVT